jgi:predicted RNA-binding Zn-ribbon protein involved in translation (DUF1610 family)
MATTMTGIVFCRGCGQSIHNTALVCPKCGAPQVLSTDNSSKHAYATYDQVPWFRRSWFIVVAFLIFAPATLYSLFSGDIYYQKNGELLTYSKVVKVITIILCLMSSVFLIGKLFGMK